MKNSHENVQKTQKNSAKSVQNSPEFGFDLKNEANPKNLNTIDQRLNTFRETKPI